MQNTPNASQNDASEPQTPFEGTNNELTIAFQPFLIIRSYVSGLRRRGNGVNLKILKGRCIVLNEGVKFQKEKSNGLYFAEKRYRFILNSKWVRTFSPEVQEDLRREKYVVYCGFVFVVDLVTGERKDYYYAGNGFSFWSSSEVSCEVQSNGDIHVIGSPLPREELRRRVPNGCYLQFVMQLRHQDTNNGPILCEFLLDIKKNVQKKGQTYSGFVERRVSFEPATKKMKLNDCSSALAIMMTINDTDEEEKEEKEEERMRESNEIIDEMIFEFEDDQNIVPLMPNNEWTKSDVLVFEQEEEKVLFGKDDVDFDDDDGWVW